MAREALFTECGSRMTVHQKTPQGGHIDVRELEVDVDSQEVTICIAEQPALMDPIGANIELTHEDARVLVAFLCKRLYGE